KNGRLVCTCCGRAPGSPMSFAEHFAREHFLRDPKYRAVMATALEQHNGSVLANLRVPMKNRAVRYHEKEFSIVEIVLDLHVVEGSSPMQVDCYEQIDPAGNKRVIHRATATAAGKKF